MDAGWEEAIKRGDLEAIRGWLDCGADVDSRDRYGQTALMLAAHAGNPEVVKVLIAYRANLNVTAKHGLSALMVALVAGHPESARLLAEAGADLSLRGTGSPGFAGKTALDLAVERNLRDLFPILQPEA